MSEERNEAPSQRRLRSMSARGNTARSTELTSMLALFAAVIALEQTGTRAASEIVSGLRSSLTATAHPDVTPANLGRVWAPMGPGVVSVLVGVLVPVALVALVTGLFQIRGRLAFGALRPNPGHLNPISGMRRMVGTEAVVGLIWPLLKLVVVAFAVQGPLRDVLQGVPTAVSGGLGEQIRALSAGAMAVARNGTAALVLLGFGDVLYRRWQFQRQARMTRREVRDEMRESEGDPMIRSRLRALRQKMARQRMLHAVPQARVVVVNPTHFAVALAYDPKKMAAPRVVAKGADHLAQKIIEIARANRVPVVPNPPLARTMYRSVEIGEPIPVALYQAIAELLAYVYSLRRRN